MDLLKQQIEQTYMNSLYFNETPSTFASKILELIGEDDKKQTRSGNQSRARWVYLTMVANELNDKGIGLEIKGLDIHIRFNKDILYQIYWVEMKNTLYPSKKRQLDTKEFSNLVEHVMDLFAMIFDIHTPFPNWKDFTRKIEPEK